jgi:hypothetical protein
MRFMMANWVVLAGFSVLWGCSSQSAAPAGSSGESQTLQLVRSEAQLSRFPFFPLLSFEQETDPVFVRIEGGRAALDSQRAHTGQRSLQIPAGARAMTIRLAPLHSGRDWPDNWTLVGAYLYAHQPQRLSAAYDVGGVTLATYAIELPAAQWTPVMIDIVAALDGRTPVDAGSLRLEFPGPLAQPIWCDDVIEMNNTEMLVDTRGTAGVGWSIVERGFTCTLERSGAFKLTLKGAEADRVGWKLEEANAIRARFTSRGRPAQRIIYADGREYVDGRFRAIDAALAEILAMDEASPGRITVSQDTGRVDRNSPGDANNDGYSEASGTYQLAASGPRMELQIAPAAGMLYSPVLEIAGLPPGKVVASMEGKVLGRVVRLEDGKVLVALDGTLQAAVAVSIRVVP